ncbi:MAG: hypothetical protein WC919_01395 [Candidatus Paceibacterota bacterium]
MSRASRVDDELNQYNEIAQTNGWAFSDVNIRDLPPNTQKYVEAWLLPFGIQPRIHKPVIGNTYVFAVDDDLIKYFIHNSSIGSHMWGDKNFDNIDNNDALAHLATKKYGGDARAIKRLFSAIDQKMSYEDN